MRLKEFYKNVVADEIKCVNFLKSKNLLPASQKCQRELKGSLCQGELKEVIRKKKLHNGTFNEIPSLRCTNSKCRTYVSIRKNNKFFTFTDLNGKCNSKLTLCSIMELVYHWVNMTKFTITVTQTGRSERTVSDWYNLCRDVCIRLYEHRSKMGGIGCIVQIDDSLFKGKRKNHKGRLLLSGVPVPSSSESDDDDDDRIKILDHNNSARNYGSRINGPWVFGMCCYQTDGTGKSKILEKRFFQVEKRDRATLLPIIKNEILPGSTIHSDEWGAYNTLGEHGFIHETVNHSVNFVDPETGAHTQTIESVWRHVKVKYGIKTRGAQNLLKEKLLEEWWRSLNPSDTFECFLRDMQLAFGVDEDE